MDHFADLPEDDLDELLNAPKLLEPRQPVRPDLLPESGFVENCPKCHGSGFFSRGRFRGPCYACKGKGKKSFKTSTEDRAKSAAQRVVKRAKTEAEKLEGFKAQHPAIFAWFDGSNFPFAIAMREAVVKFGHLTDNQLAASYKAANALEAAKAARIARVENATVVDLSKIEECLERASKNGLKAPRLRLAGLTISIAPATSKNAGAYYVKSSENGYLGKIVGGKFMRSRECTDADEVRLIEFAKDPYAAAIAYGRQTGCCSCCGAELTNKVSIERGIGPICASRFFG